MRLIEDAKVQGNGGVKTNGVNNGNNGLHLGEDDHTDEEDEEEIEPEPVSGTLVLRVISEPPSPSVSRKPSVRRDRDQPPAFLTDTDRAEQYLQVQVQRSTSSSSITGQPSSQHQSAPLSLLQSIIDFG